MTEGGNMKTREELIEHYRAVRERLSGNSVKMAAVALRAPLEPPAPVEEPPPPPPSSPPPERLPTPTKRLKYKLVLEDVANRNGVSVSDIIGFSRKLKIVRARHEACYLLHENGKRSLTWVGRRIGNMDHTSVKYAIVSYKKRLGIQENAEQVRSSASRFP
jgi:Bacterial dnaA protein helix-turn-helix